MPLKNITDAGWKDDEIYWQLKIY